MLTLIETPTFQREVAHIWSESERLDFIAWLAEHPPEGDAIPDTEGARKVRWAAMDMANAAEQE